MTPTKATKARRVRKSNGKLYWYGNGGEVIEESDASGNMLESYVFFGGKRIANRVVSSGAISYYAEDFIGSSRVITTSAGATCYDADFYPYGGESNVTNTCAQNYKFTGKERDTETGNDDFGARYYSSVTGRFLSADWSAVPAPVPYANLTNPQTLNLYAYVRNSPMSLTDPDGHCLSGTQWFCNIFQRAFYYWFTDWGPMTHAQVVEAEREYLIRQKASIGGEQRDYTKATDQQVERDFKKVIDAIKNFTATGFPAAPGAGTTSPNQMQQQVAKGQAPKSVDRVDSPRFPNEKPHIEFKDGNPLNQDGTWKHGGRDLTNAEKEWITDNGWTLPAQ